jgi:hypothetical protein
MECGEFREINSWVAASTIFGGVIRMIQLRLDNMIEEPLPTYFETLIDASLNGVLTSDTTKADNKISAVL